MPIIDRLLLRKLRYFILGPILENKGTLEGIYSVLRNIFSGDNSKYGF
jgi:hypothetical protein